MACGGGLVDKTMAEGDAQSEYCTDGGVEEDNSSS